VAVAADLESLSKKELVAMLRARETDAQPGAAAAGKPARLHDLEVHQLELEAENRELREDHRDLDAHRLELEKQNGELRQGQHDLELSQRRYVDLYDFAPIGYFTLDLGGRIQEANLTASMLLGAERTNLVGRLLSAFVARRERPLLRAHLRCCTADGDPAQAELTLAAAGRAPLTVEVDSVPLRNEDGRIVGCRTTVTDVSALKRTEGRLTLLAAASSALGAVFERKDGLAKALHEVLASIVPSRADAAFIDLVDESGLRRFAAGALPGAAPPARPDGSFASPPLGPNTPQRRVLESGQPILIPTCGASTLSGPDGVDHEPVIRALGARSLLYLPLTSRDQQLGVLTLVSVDERRRYSDADLAFASDLGARIAAAIDNDGVHQGAAAAILSRNDTLSFVAHDLRGLLNGIQLTVQLLLGRAPGAERRRGWKQLDRLQRVIEQMSNMVDDLQDAAVLENGALEYDIGDLIVDDVLGQARDMFVPVAAAKGVNLEARMTNEPIRIRADATRIIRVLGNLLGNAIKFTPAGGSVTVSSSVAHHHVLFSIRDSGIGVTPEQLPKLFDRYWQGDRTGNKGRGLGLFIAKRLVETQGGSLWAESQPGLGTTMFFTLPRSEPAEPSGAAPNEPVDTSPIGKRR
jgi:PAS domain S-box-containing protein